MGNSYERYIYKGSFRKPGGLVGEIEYLLVNVTNPTTTVDRFTFYDTATTTGSVLRVVDVEYTDATKANLSRAVRVS